MTTSTENEAPNKITVWMVEDDASYREQLHALLNERKGLSCPHAFSKCDDLFATLEAESSWPQVILMDIGLPGMNGLDGIRELASKAPDVRVIVLTVFDDEEKVLKAIDAGAAGYLLKHASTEEIDKGIRDVLSSGAALDSQVASLILDRVRNEKSKHNPLSPQETEVLNLISQGLCNKEIAYDLGISAHTVSFHLRNIYKKFDVHSQAAAVSRGIRQGFI
ncbi:response regulator transcription factor [Pelagicoccus sp. SDUM812005]|uniref:response regulator transcription factor n=1 Tax=Pelagicoccus sp. SDUM812005 TaxID=3041257 RepID=UPI00280F269B|nr:response regulator transcription factor [Pelagicoccus sp. SDUM812005]MDQ8181629.1 response regulator transcription factor [Pelagicoccus sp. SDUM812005]